VAGITFNYTMSSSRLKSLFAWPGYLRCGAYARAGLAAFLYAWVLFQNSGGLTEMALRVVVAQAQADLEQQPGHDHHAEPKHDDSHFRDATPMAQTSITTTTRQCVHHRVACPPQCHCPPLKPEAAAEVGVDFGAKMGAESQDLGLDDRSDLLPGDAAYETCHSLPVQAVAWSAMPPHLRPGIARVMLTAIVMAFPRHNGLRFQSIDLLAPDKVPIA
jgi:hypothetical protein